MGVEIGKVGKINQRVGETMDEVISREYCSKCGMELFSFSRKYSVSASDYFCVKCAEKADREYLIKNTCSVCKKLLKKDEVKLVMPSMVYGDEPMPLMDRLICTQCYSTIGNRSMDRRSFRQRMSMIRANIRKGMTRRVAQKQYSA